jgi:hypothetical protein
MATRPARAAAIGELYHATNGREAAELLIDFEQDRRVALIVAHVKETPPE